jgi:hypothetical protein
MGPHMTVIEIVVPMIPIMVPMAIMRKIVVVKMAVITIVSMPVIRAPRIPIGRIMSPSPDGMPANIPGKVNKPDDWPGCHFVGCDYDRRWIGHYYRISHVARIGCFLTISINGFDNVVFAIKRFVTNKLYPGCPVVEALNSENCNILCFIPVELSS